MDALMVLFIINEPLSYFRPYKTYFVAIYVSYLAFPISQLVLAFYPNEVAVRLSAQGFDMAAATVATLWGLLVTKLYSYPEKFSLRTALVDPLKRKNFVFLLYMIPMVSLVALALVDPNSIDPGASRTAFYVLDNGRYQAVGFSTLLLSIAAIVIVAFTVYPFVTLSRLRSELKDREVRNALRIISSCFATISVLLLVFYSLASFGYSLLAFAHLVCVILLVVAVNAFKKPTFLRAFLGLVPSLGPNPTVMRGDQIVLVYGNEQSRITSISRFVNEGLNQQERVLYFHSNSDSSARDELAGKGVDVKSNLTKRALQLPSIESLYQGANFLDEEAAIGQIEVEISDTRALGKDGLRIVVDYDETLKRPYQKFVNHVTDPRWATADHYVKVMMTFSIRAFENEQPTLSLLKSKVPVIDLTESSDAFSRTVGLSHDVIAGQKILLEFDPLSSYEKILKALATEAASNFERVVLFTRMDSPIHSMMANEAGLKMFVLTSKVSYPKVQSENVVLIPAFDSSLILDSMNKTIEAYASSPFTIVFDNVSHQMFTLGTERAHSFVRQALELMASSTITGVFLLNYPAHDSRTVSTFENLFDIELVSKPGARIPEIRRKLSPHVAE